MRNATYFFKTGSSNARFQQAQLEAALGPYADAEAILADEGLSSSERSRALLGFLVAPVPVDEFLAAHFEEAPLLVRRATARPGWYGDLLSKKGIARQVQIQRLVQGHEVTLSRYDPARKVRVNVHADGEPLLPSRFAGALAEGASVRLLAPQKHHDALWALMAGLEEAFGAMVGANAYLTPAGEQVSVCTAPLKVSSGAHGLLGSLGLTTAAGTLPSRRSRRQNFAHTSKLVVLRSVSAQGFAPHFDDIEAFVLQLEGRKRWRVYGYPEPAAAEEGDEDAPDGAKKPEGSWEGEACPLPRYSSDDFSPAHLPRLLVDTVTPQPRARSHATTLPPCVWLHCSVRQVQHKKSAALAERFFLLKVWDLLFAPPPPYLFFLSPRLYVPFVSLLAGRPF